MNDEKELLCLSCANCIKVIYIEELDDVIVECKYKGAGRAVTKCDLYKKHAYDKTYAN